MVRPSSAAQQHPHCHFDQNTTVTRSCSSSLSSSFHPFEFADPRWIEILAQSRSRPLHAHLDCFSGAAGDMMLASCLDAVGDIDRDRFLAHLVTCLQRGMPSMAHEFTVTVQRVWRGHGRIAAQHVTVQSIYGPVPAPVPRSSFSSTTTTTTAATAATAASTTTPLSTPDTTPTALSSAFESITTTSLSSSRCSADSENYLHSQNNNNHWLHPVVENADDVLDSGMTLQQGQWNSNPMMDSDPVVVVGHSHEHLHYSHSHSHDNDNELSRNNHNNSGRKLSNPHYHTHFQAHERIDISDDQPGRHVTAATTQQHSYVHSHSHHEHVSNNHQPTDSSPLLRNLHEIRTMLEQADSQYIPHWVQRVAIQVFTNLAMAEATVHGADSIENVHFHEVGAVDSIVDTVGTILALYTLGIRSFSCSRLPLGAGTVHTAHGILPVPVPATLNLLVDFPTCHGPAGGGYGGGGELITPTGAALIHTLTRSSSSRRRVHVVAQPLNGCQSLIFPPLGVAPPMTLRKIGVGAGTKDFALHPNIMRILIGELDVDSPKTSHNAED